MAKGKDIYEATQSFACEVDGVAYHIQTGDTVEAGHPLIAMAGLYFRPIEPKYRAPAASARVEDATAEPGRKRGA